MSSNNPLAKQPDHLDINLVVATIQFIENVSTSPKSKVDKITINKLQAIARKMEECLAHSIIAKYSFLLEKKEEVKFSHENIV